MRKGLRYALILAAGAAVGFCFVGARPPIDAISGRAPVAFPFTAPELVEHDPSGWATPPRASTAQSLKRRRGFQYMGTDGASAPDAEPPHAGGQEPVRDSREQLWRAARLGNAQALIALAEGHLAGTAVQRDPVRAYAFYLAWTRLPANFATPELDRRYAGGLNTTQRAEARERAKDIHRACCTTPRSPARWR